MKEPRRSNAFRRWQTGALVCLAGVFACTLAVVAGWPTAVGRASPISVCPTVPGTQNYTFLFGLVTIDSTPAAPGSVVEALNPRGNTVGCQTVVNSGEYPLMYVYGEQVVAGTPIPGMRPGEVIQFRVEGAPATPNPVPTYANDWTSHQVDLAASGATSTPTATPTNTPTATPTHTPTATPTTAPVNPYDVNHDGVVNVMDISLTAQHWLLTDPTALSIYDSIHNNLVDVGDVMAVSAHWQG